MRLTLTNRIIGNFSKQVSEAKELVPSKRQTTKKHCDSVSSASSLCQLVSPSVHGSTDHGGKLQKPHKSDLDLHSRGTKSVLFGEKSTLLADITAVLCFQTNVYIKSLILTQ